ncbi:MAG: hypothetical protein JSU94_09800 [Phycisphaerales bacterium]|nr:MAG: hypothetical protein JSU94_09800 [Phycisphaerales bacterium]
MKVEKVSRETARSAVVNVRIRLADRGPFISLGRDIVGMPGTNRIYAIAGSVRPVKKYMAKTLKVLKRVICIAH